MTKVVDGVQKEIYSLENRSCNGCKHNIDVSTGYYTCGKNECGFNLCKECALLPAIQCDRGHTLSKDFKNKVTFDGVNGYYGVKDNSIACDNCDRGIKANSLYERVTCSSSTCT